MPRARLTSIFSAPNFPPVREVLAAPGKASSHYDLGMVYAHGQGALRDDAEAARWFRISADEGYAPAQYALACMYSAGHGVPQDAAEALEWYRKAADQGLAQAQDHLGGLYESGAGVQQDYAKAALWYRRAADQNLAAAQDAHALARHQFILGRLQLQRAAGALGETDLAAVNALLE